ncbi:MAG: DUF2277 domain-containing protein [Candidatus Nephthysia bennettiae]|uniref:DUF2277 domain-containing protein n=1 Tax=Candidatus Nephthysia bennettiae TaxID=3127016 RepID=A0A934K8N0_9BACT|nr:DUF2277 domain-containing protein [Candidatus Dormibacteraeota bacterium]MBJ7612916.1 DUF2277 domain-containing protein [Candidatus Dormibacteraeota bacterium]PZR86552.1 MAG: DUF2277 domain-containing protein [Candidatus Dormibacteraeota bacterium]
MCRSIKTLRQGAQPAGEEEIRAAALQYIRKVSGFRQPSRANQEAFEAAVEEVASSSRRLLESLVIPGQRAHQDSSAA